MKTFMRIMICVGNVLLMALAGSSAWASTKFLNVQGKLADNSGTPLTGSKTVTFRLYTSSTAAVGDAFWYESQTLSLSSGLFNASLGAVTTMDSIAFNQQYYLGIQVAGDADELSPRQALGASAYAQGSLGNFNVGNKLLAGGDVFVGGQSIVAGTMTVQGNAFSIGGATFSVRDGKVGIGTSSPSTALDVGGIVRASSDILVGGQEILNGSMTVQGSAFSVGGSTFIVASGNVGIGTTSPGQRLSVGGTIESTSGGFKFPDGTTQTTAGGHTISTGPLNGPWTDLTSRKSLVFDKNYFVATDSAAGNGTFITANVPRYVVALSSGSIEYNRMFVIMSDGAVLGAGYNGYYELGLGNPTVSKSMPHQVPLPSGVRSVIRGFRTNYALMTDGTVYCWGVNTLGECGDGSTTTRYVPVRVGTLTNIVKVVMSAGIATANHACALDNAGAVWCWGYNGYGQLGTNDLLSKSNPVQVFASGVTDIYAGGDEYGYTCVILTNGNAQCTGYNGVGQLGVGVGDTTNRKVFTAVAVISNVAALALNPGAASGSMHTCAIVSGGSAYCWGYNAYGQLGVGSGDTTNRTVPTQVSGLTANVVEIVTGGGNIGLTVARMSDGTLRAWGQGSYGQCGDNGNTNRTVPVTPSGGLTTSKVVIYGGEDSGGYSGVCALTTGGLVYCWGYGGDGMIGNGNNASVAVPTQVVGLNYVVDIQPLGYSTNGAMCALASVGRAYCWGYNGYGQLGNGDTNSISVPAIFRAQ